VPWSSCIREIEEALFEHFDFAGGSTPTLMLSQCPIRPARAGSGILFYWGIERSLSISCGGIVLESVAGL
jgi:hypothetical protein